MDAILTDAADVDYSDRPAILIAASSDVAMGKASRVIEACGGRIGATLPIELAKDRIGRQGAASAVWIELDEDCGGPMDELLTHVSRDVADGRYAAVVSARGSLLDPLVARLDNGGVELIIDATTPNVQQHWRSRPHKPLGR